MSETKKTILIVEDEEMVRDVLSRVLQTRGHEVIEAVNGEEGVRKAKAEMPDMILTDLKMPVRDGLWLINALRSRPPFDPVPILIVSSLGETENILEGLRAGASDYITKPFVAEELIARVEANLRGKVLFDQLRRERDELKIVLDIMKEMTESLFLGDILFSLTQRLALMVGAKRCSVILTDPHGKTGTVIATREDPRMKSYEVDLAKYPEILQAIKTREVVVVGRGEDAGLETELAGVLTLHDIGKILVVPLIAQGSVLGVLFARTPAGVNGISEQVIRKTRIVAFAAAGAIRNASLFEQATAKIQAAKKAEKEEKRLANGNGLP